MKIPALKIGQVYEIVWMDNNVHSQIGWIETDECKDYAQDHSTSLIRSAGILFSQDKLFITLVCHKDLENDQAVMQATKIIKSCIRYIGECKSKKIYEVK